MPERSASWGTCPPNLLGFFALNLLRQGLAGRPYKKTARPAVCKAPDGAQVASPQSPILRWSKDKICATFAPAPVLGAGLAFGKPFLGVKPDGGRQGQGHEARPLEPRPSRLGSVAGEYLRGKGRHGAQCTAAVGRPGGAGKGWSRPSRGVHWNLGGLGPDGLCGSLCERDEPAGWAGVAGRCPPDAGGRLACQAAGRV
jgi:hypothetical protein